MNQKGWVKLYRKVLNNLELRKDPNAIVVLFWLLVSCNQKGEWAGGRKSLESLTGLNEQAAYRALKRLENYEIVNRSVNSKFTKVIICNYVTYQTIGEQVSEQQVNSKRTASEHYNKNKNKEYINDEIKFWTDGWGEKHIV